ncbi:MAG: hypothetical protein R2751_18895 [Bacteroidales bacterium]
MEGLEWFQASVPTPRGDIQAAMDRKEIRVSATEGGGTVRFASARTPKSSRGVCREVGENLYTLHLEGDGTDVVIRYTPVP